MAQVNKQLIANRYQLLNKLGEGGMGTVYQAKDRLTGESVALKCVTTSTDQLMHSLRGDDSDPNLTLAREFRTLSSLRHPHIVSVLDYGFDKQHQPYYTMDLLENSHPIVEAGCNLPLAEQIDLLNQLLLALAYLHRRRVIHRDLKPGNVLVVDGQVKVVDFGLSLIKTHSSDDVTQTAAGTLQYMAPELFQDGPASRETDLYAVGVIAYELFANRHPFAGDNIGSLISNILFTPVDMSCLTVDHAIANVVGRLLAKTKEERYGDAFEVIRALCHAANMPGPAETAAIRESFLQAATFVGRDAELEQLSTALDDTLQGLGSSWLIGGESGVGKSRLLDELRTHALVEGAITLRGQAVEGGGLPYQLWRDVMRRMVLAVTLSDFEAGVLKQVVPDIGNLLGRDVPVVPELTGEAGQQRLALTIVDVFKRVCRGDKMVPEETNGSIPQPIVLILEDLQWTDESLAPLRQLNLFAKDLPLMIAGNYRDDERPDLPDELPGMAVMKLERFDEDSITELSVSMLGESGQQPDVLKLLQRETEGNVFFLVEVVRALAEQAGRLHDIGRITLPAQVFAGGLQQIIHRRLGRVPEHARELLKLAAVAGRTLHFEILSVAGSHNPMIAPDVSIDDWLGECADAAVLEVHEGRWRFAHDKLRSALITDLTSNERKVLHRHVAEAIETVYPDTDEHAAALTQHWREAGDGDKECHYAQIAGKQAHRISAFTEAINLFERALELTSQADVKSRASLLVGLGNSYRALSDYPTATRHLEQGLALSRMAGDRETEGEALRGLSDVGFRQGKSDESERYADQALALAQQANDRQGIADSLHALGNIALVRGEYETAQQYYEESLAIKRETGDRIGAANTLGNLGVVAYRRGNFEVALHYIEESLAIRHENGDRIGAVSCLTNLGVIADSQGNYEVAQQNHEESLVISREIGSRANIANSLGNVGSALINRGNFEAAQHYLEESLAIRREIGDRQGTALCLGNLGNSAETQGNYEVAQQYYEESLAISREIGDQVTTALCLAGLGGVARFQGDYKAAQQYYEESLAISHEIDDRLGMTYGLNNLGLLATTRNDADAAWRYYFEALSESVAISSTAATLSVLAGVAGLLAQGERCKQAAELLGLVMQNPATHAEAQKRGVEPALTILRKKMPVDELDAALERGKSLDLDAVVADILAKDDDKEGAS